MDARRSSWLLSLVEGTRWEAIQRIRRGVGEDSVAPDARAPVRLWWR